MFASAERSDEDEGAAAAMREMVRACVDGDVMTVERILDASSDASASKGGDAGDGEGSSPCNYYKSDQRVEWKDSEGKDLVSPSPLYAAVDYGRVDVVRLFLEKWRNMALESGLGGNSGGADSLVEMKDENGYTLLHWASFGGQLEVAKVLVENFGATVDREAVDLAKESGHADVASFLFERADLYSDLEKKGDEDNDGSGEHSETTGVHAVMLRACRIGDLPKVQKLIDDGYDYEHWRKKGGNGDEGVPNAEEGGGKKEYQDYSPVWIAIRCGHVDIVRAFQEAGVEVDLNVS